MRPHMRVDTGTEPAYLNKNVRFRATHYFRVVEQCGSSGFEVDSLYRFRMTGKAHAGLTEVKFESGTLTASQIDPFGARVGIDKESGQPYFLSQREQTVQEQLNGLKRSIEQIAEIDNLWDELKRNGKMSDETEETLKQSREKAAQSLLGQASIGNPDSNGADDRKKDQPASDTNGTATAAGCDDKDQRRSFQVLGPEGWRTFSQDERLLLAMTTSDRPLIETLKQVSSRLLLQAEVNTESLDLAVANKRSDAFEFKSTLLQTRDSDDRTRLERVKSLLDALEEPK